MSRRRRFIVVAICAGLAVSMSASALAASSCPVVPRGGKVAGQGYSYFLRRTWLRLLASSHYPPPLCQTLTVGGTQHVALLVGGVANTVCAEPAGRPIYATQLASECDSLKGDHTGLNGKHYPATPAGLEKCARTFPGFDYTLSLDGHPINLDKLVTATGAFWVPKLVTPNGVRKAHAAVYGGGLLLRGLSKGTHRLVRHYTSPQKTLTFTIKVT